MKRVFFVGPISIQILKTSNKNMSDISCVIFNLRLSWSYRDLSGLIVIVFVYASCEVMQNMLT